MGQHRRVHLLAPDPKRRRPNQRYLSNYYPFQFPGRDGGDPPIELDLDFTQADLPAYWDVNKPHKEMRAFPLPSGGIIFPSYYNNGNAAYMDTTLFMERTAQFPSE